MEHLSWTQNDIINIYHIVHKILTMLAICGVFAVSIMEQINYHNQIQLFMKRFNPCHVEFIEF